MTANSTCFSTMARCLLLSVAMAVLGLTWGCGEIPSQATPDEAAKARVQEEQLRESQEKVSKGE